MKILVLGSSTNVHATVWKLKASEKFKDLEALCIPGNYALRKEVECIDDIDPNDIDRILEVAIARNISLTLCCDAKLFTKGIVDKFRAAGLAILGPTAAAVQLEASNFFAKDLIIKNHIPSPRFVAFERKEMALAFLQTTSFPIRIRADKVFESDMPIVIAHDKEQAIKLLDEMFKQKFLAKEMPAVVIEEMVKGTSFTINTVCDGKRALSLPPVQAYRDDDDSGYQYDKGAYAPTPILSDSAMFEVRTQIIDPIIAAMKEMGCPYTGILAFDVCLDETKNMEPKLIQCRTTLADSDAQVVLPLLDEDLPEVLLLAANGDLSKYKDGFHKYLGSALSINILNADRTIDNFSPLHSMDLIENLDDNVAQLKDSLGGVPLVFYGTQYIEKSERKIGQTEVFGATAIAETLVDAQVLAYKLADSIDLPSKSFQRDIGDDGMV